MLVILIGVVLTGAFAAIAVRAGERVTLDAERPEDQCEANSWPENPIFGCLCIRVGGHSGNHRCSASHEWVGGCPHINSATRDLSALLSRARRR